MIEEHFAMLVICLLLQMNVVNTICHILFLEKTFYFHKCPLLCLENLSALLSEYFFVNAVRMYQVLLLPFAIGTDETGNHTTL